MYPPDGLLTFEGTKHDVKYDSRITATDPFISDDYIDEFAPVDLLVTTTEELKMNTSDDEPLAGLNGRLRPRKSQVPSPQGKTKIKQDGKPIPDKPKRTSTPSKTSPIKLDDLANKSDFSPSPQFLCPYCDRKFASRQTVSKHIRRIHYSTPKQETLLNCLFCNHTEADSNLIQHMVDSHPNQYFACLDCHTRFPSTSELAEHKLNVCEKQKITYRTKPRPKIARGMKKAKKSINISTKSSFSKHGKDFQEGHGFNGIVISCELKPPQDHDAADIEDNITTNLILPHSKNLGGNTVLENNALIVLDDLQWNKRLPPNFSFHNTDPDQILSRLGVVHRSPRTGESTRKDWFKVLDDATQKFERCFDTKFYSKVASNVQENLAKFLDGSFNFNPDPDSTIKTRKSKNNVVINTAEGFPILLATEQYSRSVFDSYLPRAIAPKHKWKWDNLENDRSLMTAAEILKRDSHTNNCIITLVSSLDIWTQLSMRQKFDEKFNVQPVEKKTEKQNIISKELKEILESREIPTSQIVKRCISKAAPRSSELEFPASLGLVPAAPTYEVRPAVLSGEWVRPRCLVCCACGEQSTDSKGLSMHMSTRHPNANVQCYEIVGEPLLNADILKHLYVPPSQVCNRTRPPRGFRECTKCNKSITIDDLHQHMLDCAGDTPAIRRRQPRQRPFGVRRRRPRLPDNTIRKKMRKDIRSRQRRQKSHGGPRPRIRTEVGDAETIRKMLADLPAKRHRVLVNPLNAIQRPRRKLDMQRTKLILKKCSAEEVKSRKQNIFKGKTRDKNASAAKDELNKNMSGLEDDEDNIPLKPKIKLTSSSARRREPLKRQVVISTARRKSLRARKRNIEIGDKILDVSGSTEIQENCLEKSPQRLDLKKASYNIREHAANRGASNNRDGQRPGCSGTNGNSNNSCTPTQNVPLKHSIARLTANSETHDKSVQFHHSFLVQQECNNTNQHVPTGERTMFENEAVVSKLDKPPLNFCHKGYFEMQSLQKNKPNKPRKGLNDCIAMLKNKLVDPLPCQAAGYVSVQCGSDEPIDDEPRAAIKAAVDKDIIANIDLHVESVQSQAHVTIPPYEQGIINNNIRNPGNTQLQENENVIDSCRKVTTKNVIQHPEALQPQDEYEQDASHKMKQNLKQLSKEPDVSPQYRQEIIQITKTSLETMQQEKINVLPVHRPENLQKVKETHSKEKVNLVPQYGENIQNIKQTYTQPQEKGTLITQLRQESSQIIKNVSEFVHSQEEVDSTLLRQTSKSVKQSSDCSNFQEKVSLIHQYRQETSPKVKQHLPFQDRIDIVPQTHVISRKLQQHLDYLPMPENLSASLQYRQETSHNFNINPDAALFSDNLTLMPKYRTTHNIMQNPSTLHQENVTLEPRYKQASTRRLKQTCEGNSNLSQEKSAILVGGEIPKTVCEDVSPRIRSRHDPDLIQPAEAIKQMYAESDAVRKNRLENKTSWQKSIDASPVKGGNFQHSTYTEALTNTNSEVGLRNDLILPQSKDVFTDSRIRDIPANIPPAHASTFVESILSAPLDLSNKVLNATDLHHSENYDNYGTLDLSNKNTSRRSTLDIPVEENVVVDLRVKPLHPRSSPVTLDLCVKAGSTVSSDVQGVVSGNNLHSVPTDLSVKRKDLPNITVETTDVAIQDLSTSSSKHLNTTLVITPPNNENIYQIDTSNVTDKTVNLKVAQQKNCNSESNKLADSITKKISNASPEDLSSKACIKKKNNTSTFAPNADQTFVGEQNEVPETTSKSKADRIQPRVLEKLAIQLQKHVFDPTLKIPQYKIRANMSVTEITSPEHTEESAHAMTSISQDLVIQNSSAGLFEGFNSTTTNSSVPPLACAVIRHPIPDRPSTSFVSSFESTTPVYTANSCITVAKIESSNEADVSTISKTKTSTVPVNTLTDKVVDLRKAPVNEDVNGSASSEEFLDDSLSESDTSEDSLDDDFYDDFTLFLDPETAKKVALLPKKLVKILGTLPEDHRNQLLEILPQYVSVDSNRRIRESIASIRRKKKLSKLANNKVIPKEPQHQKEHPDISDQVLEVDEQNHNKSTPSVHKISTDIKYQSVTEGVKLDEKSKTLTDLKPNETVVNACIKGSTDNEDSIIDLTKDETLPPIPTVVDLSSSITIPPQDLSVSGTTGVPSKQKGNNDKTASLRAVRIKAPSLRQKEKHLSLISEERVLAQIEHDAVIQLAEMSMLQLDRASDIDTKETVLIKPAETIVHSIEETGNLRVLSAGGAVDKNMPATTGEGNKISNTVAPNLPLLNCDSSNKKQSEAGNINQLYINRTVINANIENTTNEVYQSGDNIISPNETLNNNNLNVSMQENKIIETHEEEDSDDDIILAAIVKQKQQTKTLTKKNIKKKKGKKKSKNNLLVESNSIRLDNAVTLSCNVDSVNLKAIEDPPKNKLEQNKKKGTSDVFKHDTVREEQNYLGEVNPGNEPRKVQLSDLDSCGDSRNAVTEEHGKENNDNLTNVNRTNQTETMSAKSQEGLPPKLALNLKQSENVLQIDKPKKKKKFADVNIYKLTEQDVDESQVATVALKLVASDKTTASENKVPQCCNLVSNTNDLLVMQDSNKQDSVESKSEVKNIVKIVRSKKYSSSLCKDNSTTESQDDEDTSDTPLRRSRRGKSVYVERSLTAHENFNIDFNVDQKTPLTKKQLIFSKLLLDEEKQTRSLIASSEKEMNDIDKIDPSKTASEALPQSCKTDISEDITQKCKPVKRKKSQFKKKGKKKKSVGESFSEDFSVTDESDNNIKSNQANLTIEDAVPSADTITCDEPNDQIKKGITIMDSKISHTTKDNASLSDEDIERKESHSLFSGDNNNAMPNKTVPEKRKISKLPPNIESDLNLKPKKTKFNKVKDDDLCKNPENEVKISNLEVSVKPLEKSETSITTCYDMPVAARRTRSKSVVIKSSGAELYDPYDIDLDDMIQKPEPLRKTGLKAKEIKAKRKSSSKLPDTDVSEERELPLGQKRLITESAKLNKKKCDSLVPVKKAVCDQEAKTKVSTVMISSTKTVKNINLDKTPEVALKDAASDSDESSKSDVPLKKYVESRVKKLATSGKTPPEATDNRNEKESKKHKNSRSKKNLRIPTVNKKSVDADLSNELEQQMRSEQFMESFGFFSERKPRKSNLLATKKISETFHIIANEREDLYYSSKERPSRKSLQSDTKKSTEISKIPQSSIKRNIKRGRKKKDTTPLIRYCDVCKKEFRRPDNYARHILTLLHVSKLSEVEFKVKTIAIPEEPNYLIAYKQQMDRLKILTDQAAKQNKNSKTKIVLPSLVEILAEVHKIVREQQLARRGLSRDEALFLDCCELLNKPCRQDIPAGTSSGLNALQCSSQSAIADLDYASRSDERSNLKNDDDVDSITAKTIMESEEIRYLENDLISGLHQIANVKLAHKKDEYHATPCTMTIHPHEISSDIFSRPDCDIHCQQMKVRSENFSGPVVSDLNKTKKLPEYKEKMYPDIIEDIDMFEDKFDKIKRKCRSQAAAAKQVQSVTEPSLGHRGKKKTDKKKVKKGSKKINQNTVMTKGALKGFDGIKVSIPTSDINMSAIGVVLHESSQKKKRKTSSKKKREKDSETSSKIDSDHHLKGTSYSQKKVDVYEFMDNEDAELFEFRPSTLMERFKSINKETPSTSKRNASMNDPDNSSESASDGDDFVYMSDDYVCSDDETENSSLSCELGNGKIDGKKSTPLKRKDVVEKNAVMGKIFKHNAVRHEKKIVKSKETVNPKANLDQLFDSLLEEKPNMSLQNTSDSRKLEEIEPKKQLKSSPKPERSSLDDSKAKPQRSSLYNSKAKPERSSLDDSKAQPERNSLDNSKAKPERSSLDDSKAQPERNSLDNSKAKPERSSLDDSKAQPERSSLDDSKAKPRKPILSPHVDIVKSSLSSKNLETEPDISINKYDTSKRYKYGPSFSKQAIDIYAPSSSGTYVAPVDYNKTLSTKRDSPPSKKHDIIPKSRKSPARENLVLESALGKSQMNMLHESGAEIDEDTGVARHRARRKCTVGKQNVLAETWSSESEPDGLPPRPASADSVVASAGRKKKGRKRDGQQAFGRRGKVTFNKKHDIESRVTSNKWSTTVDTAAASHSSASNERSSAERNAAASAREACPPPAPPGPASASAAPAEASTSKARPRPAAYYWTSEGDDEQEHQQQHGWIVGNSHKRLVTMLAHAKGRKRNNDDKRHLVE